MSRYGQYGPACDSSSHVSEMDSPACNVRHRSDIIHTTWSDHSYMQISWRISLGGRQVSSSEKATYQRLDLVPQWKRQGCELTDANEEQSSRPMRFPKWLCTMTVINAFPMVDIDRGSSRRRLQSPLLDGLDEIKSQASINHNEQSGQQSNQESCFVEERIFGE
jgi:hypothetical protein